ncbi:MAG TPA: MOSC domain-containing protein [Rhizomicrobium sp.]|nr:MOSC domain-containing protein [Rhizomicrobium sp.]
MSGRLIGIGRAREKRAPLEQCREANVTAEAGIQGDVRGSKPGRQVTVLFREGWDDACRELGVRLPWVTRRANLLVEGIERPRRIGDYLQIGDIVLAVRDETKPCNLMELAHSGLRGALQPDWRGGVCCDVVSGGTIRVGDPVSLAESVAAAR